MRRDNAYLLDILIAARKALKFGEGIDGIDFGVVWDTIHKDLPKLIEIIEPLVPKEDEL
jgi:uncharacterized protein with HEPN domain